MFHAVAIRCWCARTCMSPSFWRTRSSMCPSSGGARKRCCGFSCREIEIRLGQRTSMQVTIHESYHVVIIRTYRPWRTWFRCWRTSTGTRRSACSSSPREPTSVIQTSPRAMHVSPAACRGYTSLDFFHLLIYVFYRYIPIHSNIHWFLQSRPSMVFLSCGMCFIPSQPAFLSAWTSCCYRTAAETVEVTARPP